MKASSGSALIMSEVGTNQFGLDSNLYTRGKPGEADKRGESMVLRHAEKLQQEKEEAALRQLADALPNLGTKVKVVALTQMDWEVNETIDLLRHFCAANVDKLRELHKKRRRLSKDLDKPGPSVRAVASDSEGNSSDSESSSDEEGRQRSKPKKPTKKHKKSKKRKQKHKHKSKPKAGNTGLSHSDMYGKYGIIRETDYHSRRPEFALWAMEVKNIDVDAMPKYDERELFKDFIEDYNTCTLPHRKYYDLDKYERKKIMKAAKKGSPSEQKTGPVDDEEQLRRERAAERARQQEERFKQAYAELKYSDKAKDMREQELLRAQAALAYKTGDTATAQKLMDRLAPDDKRKDEREVLPK